MFMLKFFFLAPFSFLYSFYKERYVIGQLTLRDFRAQYIDSYLGLFWAFFQPVVFTSVIYFIFSHGIRSGGGAGDKYPFIAYLITGMIAWFYFSGVLAQGSNAIRSNSFLVRRSGFTLQVLPLVKIFSNLFAHAVFVTIAGVILVLSDVPVSLYWSQVLYYLFAAMALLLGVGLFLSSIAVFVPDVNRFIPVLVQIGFWATPIFWKLDRFPEFWQKVLVLNPAFYIVNGYRDSFLYGIGFWERPFLTLYFWGIVFFFFLLGMITFRRLRPHFAEIL